MVQKIDALHVVAHELSVSDAAFHERHMAARLRFRQILTEAADQIVDHHDFRDAFVHELVHDMRADEPSPARDHHSAARQLNTHVVSLRRPRENTTPL